MMCVLSHCYFGRYCMAAMTVSEALMMMLNNIIYDLCAEADAGVCFGVVATQYVNGLMPY